MDDAPVGDDDLHPDVMSFGRDRSVYQLKIVAQSDQVGFSPGVLQEPVVETLAVADAVAGQGLKEAQVNHVFCF